ncbi:MAG: phosphate acyltransferase PlsX, partial [Ilumatobacteraceae bacterium]
MLPIAVDALGGDRAPQEVLAGVRDAVALGIPVVLIGPPDLEGRGDLPLIPATEFIAMDDDPGKSVRTKKDSTLVRAAEAVRDGKASAMISAGNTGATMASALLRMGRIKGVSRPAIATPIPVPGGTPTVLLDAGANAEVQADWLVQFAQMGSVYAEYRYGISSPRVGLLSIGEEPGKGDSLRKEAYELLSVAPGIDFIGNVEGRDVMSDAVDVVVTDGFTGNVVLKTLEGGMKTLVRALMDAFSSKPEYKEHADVLLPALL